jgi:hypothetical protein
MKRRVLIDYDATERYHVVRLNTDPHHWHVVDTRTSRSVGRPERDLRTAWTLALDLARAPPLAKH